MADSRYDTKFHDPAAPKKRRMSLFDIALLAFTLACVVALFLSYLGSYVDPRSAWLFAFLGLASPLLYIVNLLLALLWVLRWKIIAVLPALALLVGLGSLPLFYHPALRKHYDKPDEKLRPDLRVMSYNVEAFLSGTQGIGALIEAQTPDILCLQEYQTSARLTEARIDTLLGSLRHKAVDFELRSDEEKSRGVAIYSRFPLLAPRQVYFGASSSALQADLVVGKGDTMRVLTCHLQTTSLSRFMARNGLIPNSFGSLKGIVRQLRDNYRLRAAQADTLAAWIEASPYPVVVCGDFNDTPISYTYHRIRTAPEKGRLRDAFARQGRGAASTYRGMFNLLRIDYIFHSKHWEAVSYDSPEVAYSDHRPVVVGLKKTARGD